MLEILHIPECKNVELQSENKIEIETEAHFTFDCDVAKECPVWPNIAAQTLFLSLENQPDLYDLL
ncbi:hypothetical protein [Leptospira dzoumogneensis]|uniref:Uncharacterized protein n=1 Tax=Leptospira dzoumogneensis TaxID=2484904 RepID=A0A4Z1ATU4_9LEPT|nr:hypothetical protein [Leptospira dzoumogneensis]TGM99457.1 hypothetical protein EHR06_09985 [Leptospira dzoumogneensis]